MAWEAGRAADAELSEFIRQTAELLAAAQRDDGYLNSHYQVVHPASGSTPSWTTATRCTAPAT